MESIAPQLSIDLEFSFMGANLIAEYSAIPDGIDISLVLNEVTNASVITISEMVADLNHLTESSAITSERVMEYIRGNISTLCFDDVNEIDFTKIKFRLKNLMLKIHIGNNGEKSVTYAISLAIVLDGLFPDIKIINIKSLDFCIKNI